MKILTILGSPRKHGNTAAVLKQFEDLLPYPFERINITDHPVKGCLGCDACQKKKDKPGCCQSDGLNFILPRIMSADVVVYATPLYAWDFSAQMKALIDRHYCLVKWNDTQHGESLIPGKRAALLVTCSGEIENNADTIQTIFDREINYLKGTVIGKYIVPNCSTPRAMGDKAITTAQAMIRDLGGPHAS